MPDQSLIQLLTREVPCKWPTVVLLHKAGAQVHGHYTALLVVLLRVDEVDNVV